MKKQFLFLAGSAILLASCGNNNNADNGAASQQKIDSAVKAGEAAKEADIKRMNDSTIVAQAKSKADSQAIAKEAVEKDHAKHPGAKHHGTTTTTTTTASVTPTSTNPKDARFNPNTQTEQKKTDANKKADRFK